MTSVSVNRAAAADFKPEDINVSEERKINEWVAVMFHQYLLIKCYWAEHQIHELLPLSCWEHTVFLED